MSVSYNKDNLTKAIEYHILGLLYYRDEIQTPITSLDEIKYKLKQDSKSPYFDDALHNLVFGGLAILMEISKYKITDLGKRDYRKRIPEMDPFPN
jgi:hypothetical protein